MIEEKLQLILQAILDVTDRLSWIDMFSHSVGLLGMICVVTAYYTIEQGKYSRDDSTYYIINLVGAILLTVSLFFNFNLGSFVIEIFWMTISIKGLMRIFKQNHHKN